MFRWEQENYSAKTHNITLHLSMRQVWVLELLCRAAVWHRWPDRHEVGDDVDGDGEHNGGVVLGRDAVQRL